MDNLILDIKIEIASKDEDVWYHLYKYNKDFNRYAISNNGKKIYTIIY
jgi:hypothetical protein